MSAGLDPDDPATLGLDTDVLDRVVGPSAEAFRRLVGVMAKLRSPTGCPWDQKQTHATLARHLLEETYEVLEAIEDDDLHALREELGDLVLQVVFHAQLGYEEEVFTVADVCDDLRAKLVRRHPHVFGDQTVSDADEVLANWEKLKRDEKGTGITESIPRALPALARAAKLARRAAGVGFDWPSVEDAARKVDEEMGELHDELVGAEPDPARLEAEIGDALFAMAGLARKLGVEPESALRRAADAFAARFAAMEEAARADGRDLESLSARDWKEYWERAKQTIGRNV